MIENYVVESPNFCIDVLTGGFTIGSDAVSISRYKRMVYFKVKEL